MAERTIAHLARELAGTFYDHVREAESAGDKVQMAKRGRVFLEIDPKLFAKTFPTVRDYLRGRRHGRIDRDWKTGRVSYVDDGSVTMSTPGWLYWYDQARQMLTVMLGRPDIHDNVKQGIYAALLEDREKELKQRMPGPHVTQRHVLGDLG